MTTTTLRHPPLDGRIRVLMLVDKVRFGGGAERFMAGLATTLPRDRFEVMVATTRTAGGRVLDILQEGDIPHFGFHRRSRFDVTQIYRLARFLREQRIDVVHAHMFGSNLWGSILGSLAGVPVIVAHEHTWSYEGEPLRKWLDGRVTGRLADVFVAVSERDRTRMIELEKVPAEKIRVMPVPFIRRAGGEPRDVRAELGIAPDAPVIGAITVLREQKAVDVLLEAFARLSQRMPEARLVIAGEGHLRPVLEALSERLGLTGTAHFIGWCEDVAPVLAAADVAALSSDYEGSPLVALECAEHGAPLVSTDVGNVRSLLGEDGVVVVPRRDPAALAEALEAMLRDPERRAAQAAAAARRVPEHELETVTQQFADLYERLLAGAGPRRAAARVPALG
jgi:glycosyltransferase involved in cell wall biosynthesis